MSYFLSALIAYLIGCISGSFLISKIYYKEDIRDKGSGNAGTTNMFRAYGKKAAVITFFIDFLKGFFAVLSASFIEPVYGPYIAGTFVIIGHVWPVFLGFRGGKGIASSIGVYAYHIPILAALQGLIFFTINTSIKIVSLGSIVITILSLFYALIFHNDNHPLLIMIAVNVAIIIYSHRSNIKKLRSGKEETTEFLKG